MNKQFFLSEYSLKMLKNIYINKKYDSSENRRAHDIKSCLKSAKVILKVNINYSYINYSLSKLISSSVSGLRIGSPISKQS